MNMQDYWNISATALNQLIGAGGDPFKFNYIFLYSLVAGFLSMTLYFVIWKRDTYWASLDGFSKAAVSIIVGSISYLWVTIFYLILRIMDSIIKQSFNSDLTLNYYGFVGMIMFPFVIITILDKVYKKKRKVDQFYVLSYFHVTSILIFSLFTFGVSLLFISNGIILSILTFRWHLLIVILIGIILLYSSYCMLSLATKELIDKRLPCDCEYLINKIREEYIECKSKIKECKEKLCEFLKRIIKRDKG